MLKKKHSFTVNLTYYEDIIASDDDEAVEIMFALVEKGLAVPRAIETDSNGEIWEEVKDFND